MSLVLEQFANCELEEKRKSMTKACDGPGGIIALRLEENYG